MVVNYEWLFKFDFDVFGVIVFDESLILKLFVGWICNMLMDVFKDILYKFVVIVILFFNDYMEFGNYVEFLGVMC